MSTGTTIAAAIGGLVAAEATGITNFSGGQGPIQGSPILPSAPNSPIPVPSGDSSGIGGGELAAILSSQNQGDSGGIGGGELAAILSSQNQGNSGMPSGSGLAAFLASQKDGVNPQVQTLLDRNKKLTDRLLNQGKDKAGDVTSTDPLSFLSFVPGIGGPGGPNLPGTNGPGSSGLDTSTSDGFDLQDFAGTGPLGNAAAFFGESGVATGEAGNATASAINDTVNGAGEILGDPLKVARGNGANAGGLFGTYYNAGAVTGQAISEFEAPKIKAPKIKTPKIKAPRLNVNDIKAPDISDFPTTGFL